jgi:hypothetical protein
MSQHESDDPGTGSATMLRMQTRLEGSCGCFDMGAAKFELLTRSSMSKFAKQDTPATEVAAAGAAPSTPDENSAAAAAAGATPSTPATEVAAAGARPSTPDENSAAAANTPSRRFLYVPKTKYQHSYYDENGIYWPSTAKKRRLTEEERAAAAETKRNKKTTADRQLVDMSMRRAEIFNTWENGAVGVPRHNKRAVARFLLRKYPDRYAHLNSALSNVKRTLKKVTNKFDENPSQNPFRDGRTTAKMPRWVVDNADIRQAIQEGLDDGKSSRQLASGRCPP